MDMIRIFVAITISILLWYSMQGVLSATYILMAILGLISFVVFYSSIISLGTMKDIVVNPETYSNVRKEKLDDEDYKVKLLLNLIYIGAAYHLFTIGYIAFSSVAIVLVLINFLGGIVEIVLDTDKSK